MDHHRMKGLAGIAEVKHPQRFVRRAVPHLNAGRTRRVRHDCRASRHRQARPQQTNGHPGQVRVGRLARGSLDIRQREWRRVDLDGEHVHAPSQQGVGNHKILEAAINSLLGDGHTFAFYDADFRGIVLGKRQQVRLVAGHVPADHFLAVDVHHHAAPVVKRQPAVLHLGRILHLEFTAQAQGSRRAPLVLRPSGHWGCGLRQANPRPVAVVHLHARPIRGRQRRGLSRSCRLGALAWPACLISS